ncbi:hypothetical protein OH799_11220 [Nocardia sp. NBC_00881]|uniref:hypothetical protein n=1 Tax=Nocardia sp. NBC_00881 TaxID=2975995 RepID=UPI00386D8377|nr:hypothetical protein OH799_11220 [Nocardia sp. NBC_00881]
MPAAAFAVSAYTNSSDYGSAYTLFATDNAPLRGQVFADMSEHNPIVDGIAEARPMVVLRFFGLVVDGERFGNPRITARFEPGTTGRGATALVCLGEPGYLGIDLGYPLATADADIRELVSDTVTEITGEFLTDDRAARYRHWAAEQRRQHAAHALEAIQSLEQLAFHRHATARAEADASWALVQALRPQH